MRHPAEGVLRRLLDEPAGVSDPDRGHVAACPACLDALAAARADAAHATGVLGHGLAADPAAGVDLEAAWQRLAAAPAPAAPVVPLPSRRPRGLLRRPAAAGVAVALVVSGASAAAAQDWLQVFRTERVAPVVFSTEDLVALPDLSDFGDVRLDPGRGLRAVRDLEEAREATGLDAPQVLDLPDGLRGEPELQVVDRVTATFTFDAEEAAQEAGPGAPAPPPELDGAQVRLAAGPGVAAVWSGGGELPGLVVARAVAPSVATSGVPFAVLRDHLLSLPGLPPELADRLRALAEDGATLPLPAPSEEVDTRPATVDGAPATVLRTRDDALAAVVYVHDGLVTVVAGALEPDEVLGVARELQ